ncbi:hypothetical protein DPMN_047607 [Dreissena polymorpha]|uniref:Uncharacterized protein n=1 Tax=Dreissena polymorpha TaxID=45954 RepID=A0A9D4HZA7_DREPO|nr:hypothetical protein DPMN_047607 [Dreissena polymorpha]
MPGVGLTRKVSSDVLCFSPIPTQLDLEDQVIHLKPGPNRILLDKQRAYCVVIGTLLKEGCFQ